MKAYIMTTGAVFGLITLAHLLRIIAEGPRLFPRLHRGPLHQPVRVVARQSVLHEREQHRLAEDEPM